MLSKKQKINLVVIASAIISIILVFYFSPLYYLSQLYGKLDPDLKHILITVVVAGLGGSLFAFRNKAKGEIFELFEAMELLLLMVIPSVEGFTLIMKNPSNYSWAVALYISAVMGWFVLVITRHKTSSDPKKEKLFTTQIAYLMLMLVAFGVFADWQLTAFSPFLAHKP